MTEVLQGWGRGGTGRDVKRRRRFEGTDASALHLQKSRALSDTRLESSLAANSLGPFFYTSLTQSPPVSFLFFWSGRGEKAGSLGEARMHTTKFEVPAGSV